MIRKHGLYEENWRRNVTASTTMYFSPFSANEPIFEETWCVGLHKYIVYPIWCSGRVLCDRQLVPRPYVRFPMWQKFLAVTFILKNNLYIPMG